MFQPNGSTIECDTCVAANTSACTDCIVNFVLANDDGPVEFAPVDPLDVAVQLFVRAGLVDEPVVFVTAAEFAAPGPVVAVPAGAPDR